MRLIAACLLVLLAGCAQSPIKEAWLPGDTYWDRARVEGARLIYKDRSVTRYLPPRVIDNLVTVREKLQEVSLVRADLAIVDTDSPNAFATVRNGRNVVAFSVSFLQELGGEVDALATTMGHELAHLELKHSEKRKGREEGRQALGFALGFFLGPLGTVADAGATAYINSFTRDEERDADDLGMRWAIKAGYSPCGHKKVVAMFRKHSTVEIPFLSTHPGFTEREGLADEYAAKTGQSC